MRTPPRESTNNPREGLRSLVASCLERDTFLFSAKTALVLGTLLALVNDGGAFLAGRVAPDQLFTSLASYLVLFVLALYSQVQGKRQRDHTERVEADR